jgi:hypothetical protein
MASWPASLPQRLHQQGFQYQAPTGSIRTDMEFGKPFQRRRFTAAVEPFSGQMYLDKDQYSTLLAFWKNTLAMGSLEFDWVHPITEEAATVRFVADSPFSISVASGEVYTVKLNLEIIP